MSDDRDSMPSNPDGIDASARRDDPNTITPLQGEPGVPSVARGAPTRLSRKVLGTLAVMGLVLVGALVLVFRHWFSTGHKADDAGAANGPAAAIAPARSLDLSPPPRAPASSAAPSPIVPALVPTEAERADPIGVRRTGAPTSGSQPKVSPEDAPVLLVTSRPTPSPAEGSNNPPDPLEGTKRNLEGYQRQLQQLMDSLSKGAGAIGSSGLSSAPPSTATTYSPPPLPGGTAGGIFGGQLQGSATPRVAAGTLGNRSLTLPKGTAFTCALKTRVVSAASGLVGCEVQRNVFSDDGRVLLVERGSHMDGEYRIVSVRPGMVRIPVLWTRLRTPLGVTVDIDSPATGPLGESGIDGYVDNRWMERIGAAMLLSVIDDSVKLIVQSQANESSGSTFVLPSTAGSSSKLAEKVLDSTINIPPLIYQNQGGIVGVYVARDVDFSTVYALAPSAMPVALPSADDPSNAKERP